MLSCSSFGAAPDVAPHAGRDGSASPPPTPPGAVVTNYRDLVMNDRAIAYFPFDDVVGEGRTTTSLVGGFSCTVNGAKPVPSFISGTALELDGSTSYLDCGMQEAFDFKLTTTFSIEAWISPLVIESSERDILSKTQPGNTFGYRLFVSTDYGIAIARSSGATTIMQAPLAAGGKNHIVATYDGLYLSIYVDGASHGSTADTADAVSTVGTALFLGAGSQSARYFKGVIDEVAIYAYALDPKTVSNHWTARPH